MKLPASVLKRTPGACLGKSYVQEILISLYAWERKNWKKMQRANPDSERVNGTKFKQKFVDSF